MDWEKYARGARSILFPALAHSASMGLPAPKHLTNQRGMEPPTKKVCNGIDIISEMPRDFWFALSRFLNLVDLKTLCRCCKTLNIHVKRILFYFYWWDVDMVSLVSRRYGNMKPVNVFAENHSEIPKGVQRVSFAAHFNQFLQLPEGIKDVTFGKDFNREVEIPESVVALCFKGSFNQPLTLPSGLKRLKLSFSFEHDLVIPPGVEYVFRFDFQKKQLKILDPDHTQVLHVTRNNWELWWIKQRKAEMRATL
jgi:hypothetical protein